MAEPQIRFDDGAAYERMMGVWSRLAGDILLDWLARARVLPGGDRGLRHAGRLAGKISLDWPAPRSDRRWSDVGCGNAAFTDLIEKRHAPAEVQGIDPSE